MDERGTDGVREARGAGGERAARRLARELARRIARRSRKPAVALAPKLDVRPDPLGTFLGGMTYWSPDGPVTSSDGERLRPLAQLRCADLDLEGYPNEGLLQFFIGTDDLYGCTLGLAYDGPEYAQDTWRVRYLTNVPSAAPAHELVTLPEPDRDADEMSPFERGFLGCALVPTRIEQPVSVECDELEPLYEREVSGFAPSEVEAAEAALPFGLEQQVSDYLSELAPDSWFQVGGYPTFTQADVREDYEDELVLLKVDSYDDVIMWGDVGVADFLIRREDLARLDFSHVLYTWDCG